MYQGSLKEFGVTYNQVDFLENGDVDLEGIKEKINDKILIILEFLVT